jgi:ribosomal protein L7/L12
MAKPGTFKGHKKFEASVYVPKKVKEGVSKEDTKEALKTLEAAGAKCSIK